MDSALKQRLVGAAVLVAVAVIVLPLLIGGPDDTTPAQSTTVPLDIPQAPDRRFETRELSPVQPVPAAPGTVAPAAAEDRVVTVDASAPDAAAPDANAGFDLSARPSQAAAPSSGTAAPPPPRPVAAPAAQTPDAAAPPAVTTAPAPGAGGYAVNLGSYANAANASALVAQLKQRDLPAYAEPVQLDGKPAQRVRLGPYAQRAQAESARLTVQQLRRDVPAAVVALDGEPAAPATAKPAVASGFAVQIGALKSEQDASALRDRARGAGFPAYTERAVTEAGVLWRVRVGPELQRANAERVRDEIKTKLNLDGNVVTHP